MNEHEVMARLGLRKIRRELSRRLPLRFNAYIRPDWITAAHHEVLGAALLRVLDGDLSRLIISMPPRHGKSLMSSVLFPALWLARNPDKQIIHISYASALSNEFSRQVRAIIRDDPMYGSLFPHMQLDPDRGRIDDWKLVSGGGFKSVGVQGGVTGHGADLMVIDDPVKEGDEQSAITLESIYEWYLSAARTRLHPGAAVVIVMTRWHPLDLVGRLLSLAAADESADQWEQVVLPALAGDDDPLGRKPGEALWPERVSRRDLLSIRALSERYFEALFQQNPKISDSPMFREEDFKRDAVVNQTGVWCFDLAISESTRADYSVFARFNHDADSLCVDGIQRFRSEWPGTKNKIIALMLAYPDDLFVFPKQTYELMAVQSLRAAAPGAQIIEVSMPKDKVSRAAVFSDWTAAGRVVVETGKDGDYFVWEHVNFPDAASHDDCVDVSSVATHHFGLGRITDVMVTQIDSVSEDFAALVYERLSI